MSEHTQTRSIVLDPKMTRHCPIPANKPPGLLKPELILLPDGREFVRYPITESSAS